MVVSYGQVATAVGFPTYARHVGRTLSEIDFYPSSGMGRVREGSVPWWRVVNNQGVISIKGNWFISKETQKQLLEKEGIVVSNDYKLDIKKYRYNKT